MGTDEKQTKYSILVFFLFLGLVHVSSAVIIQPDNTCPHGNNYLQFVGFACVASEERERNPSAEDEIAAWESYGNWDVWSYHVMNHLANRHGIYVGGVRYCSNFTIVNSGCNGDVHEDSFARTTVRQWASHGDFFFGAWGSTLSLPALKELSIANKIVFTPTTSSTINFKCQQKYMDLGMQPECLQNSHKRFPTAYSLMVPGSERTQPMIDLFRLAGVKSVSVWQMEGTSPADSANGAVSRATFDDIAVKHRIYPEPTQESFDDMVKVLKADDSESVIGAGYEHVCALWSSSLKKNDWLPKAFGVTHCVGYKSAKEDAPDANYGLDFTEFDPRMKGEGYQDDFWFPPEIEGRNSATIFKDECHSILLPLSAAGIVPEYNQESFDWSMALIVASMQVIMRTVNASASLLTADIQKELQQYSHPSFMGQIGFSNWGLQNLRDVILVQPDAQYKLQIVYPLGSATMNFVYPIPTFKERVFDHSYLSKTVEIVLASVIGFLILLSLVLSIVVWVFRGHRIIVAASPLFLLTILFGSILLYSTYFAWTLQAATVSCYLRYWLLGVGFVTMFGALFAKTWRIMRIFLQSNIRIFKITNWQLMAFLGVLVGIECGLLAIWSGTSRPVAVVKLVDPHRPQLNKIVCQNGKAGLPMLIILFVYKLAIVIYGSYMSIRIWKIPMKLFNESRSIAFSMYNMLAFGLLGFGLQVSGSISDPAMFIIRTLCIAISTFCTILALFIPKIKSLHDSISTSSSGSSNSFPSTLRTTDITDSAKRESKTKSHDFSLASRPRKEISPGADESINVPANTSEMEKLPKSPRSKPMTVATEEAYKDKIKRLKKELKKSNKALNALQMTLLTYQGRSEEPPV